MERIAIYPGSFDPFTLGHLSILRSALGLFDKIIIGIGYNHTKRGFLKVEKRLELILDIISEFEESNTKVEVCAYEGMTIDFCRNNNIKYIIRGLRTYTDFENELIVAQANTTLAPEIFTVFLPASSTHSFISSSIVRDVHINGGQTSELMPKGIDLKKYVDEK